MKKTQINFDAKALTKTLVDNHVQWQTELLIDYAEKTIMKIGNKINSYTSRNHMDRTGNLLNSLCWGVYYRGELKASGFYRNAESLEDSYLHEWLTDDLRDLNPVNGHALAEAFIKSYKGGNTDGWKVFFAVLAPYWGYWEEGFTMKHGFSTNGTFTGASFKKFAVMTEFYDVVKEDLKPAKVTFKTKAPEYTKTYKIGNVKILGSLQRRAERLSRDPYAEQSYFNKRRTRNR